ncbi:hypothetical protein XELAEV_18029352mg [Xenopus laevis]|uniref:GIY-YIG domain-containing protein n=1 Tax=Xenopus laevis TaxID=8355 RepID=A0A974HHJ1_XENLA|nr:hypothetical protein XELAEV_18029352mg [Xenopus laevis]
MEKTIKKYWPILKNDKYKRQERIFQGKEVTGTYPCLQCICWASVIKGNVVQHPTKRVKIHLKHYATCNTSSVVYMLKCPCGKVYVGQTVRAVKERIKEHKDDK